MISTADKLKCLQRELNIRRHVYPNRVLTKRMSQRAADHEIACIEAMIEDYKRGDENERAGGSSSGSDRLLWESVRS